MSRIIVSLIAIILFSTSSVFADAKTPRWTLEMNSGIFQPEDNNWSSFYGNKRMPVVGISMAYRVFSILDLGASYDYSQDEGVGFTLIDGSKAGNVTYRASLVEIYALLRLRFAEGQWIVPYGGGGYTRFLYMQTGKDVDRTRGSVNAYHARAGFQLLLDGLDPSAAKEMLRLYGAVNSYWYFEVKRTKAEAGSVPAQIGGYSAKSGLMIEFR